MFKFMTTPTGSQRLFLFGNHGLSVYRAPDGRISLSWGWHMWYLFGQSRHDDHAQRAIADWVGRTSQITIDKTMKHLEDVIRNYRKYSIVRTEAEFTKKWICLALESQRLSGNLAT